MAVADIGFHFPHDDESIKGISSEKILSFVIDIMKRRGFRIVNIDTVVIAEEPRIVHHREVIRRNLAHIMGIGKGMVNVKGKTAEGLGIIGEKDQKKPRPYYGDRQGDGERQGKNCGRARHYR